MAKKKSDKEAEQKPASTKKICGFLQERNNSLCNRVGTGHFLSLFVTGLYLFLFSLEQLTKVLLIAEMPRTLLL